MKIAISPCPNDTFLFHAWLNGLVGQDIPAIAEFADIQQLNEWALEKRFPLIKISLGCYAGIEDDYELLPVGAAIGFQCGPKIISKTLFNPLEISHKTIAVPGQDTTAHLLLKRLLPEPRKKVFCLYHEIASLIDAGIADCGLIIHESRFTFAQSGFIEIADLGELWHAQTKAPLPLGALALQRTTPLSVKKRLIAILQESLALAHSQPKLALPFILLHSQEKDPAIVIQHIKTYVTSETAQLSSVGEKAIHQLLQKRRPTELK